MDNGCWLWSDSGWYWQSYYTWGWAPFHYGRWFQHPHHGWTWRPDRHWGPAWVTWRQSREYCGWAPLPPEARWQTGVGLVYRGRHVGAEFDFGFAANVFHYIPTMHFCARDLTRHPVSHGLAQEIHAQSTVVNVTINNTVVVNRGVPRDVVARSSQNEVRNVVVRTVPLTGPRGLKAERLAKENSGLVIDHKLKVKVA